MRRLLSICLILLFAATTLAAASPQGRDELAVRFDDAFFAWDTGDYIPALEGFLEILRAPGGDRFLEDIALISGELYVTEEIAVDGSNARISADGRYAAYETRVGNDTVTWVAFLDGSREPMRVEGTGLAFARTDDLAAYLAVEETDEIRAAIAALDEIDSSDRAAMRTAQQELQELRRANTHIEHIDLRIPGPIGPLPEPVGPLETESPLATPVFGSDGRYHSLYFVVGGSPDDDSTQIVASGYERLRTGGSEAIRIHGPETITSGGGFKTDPVAINGGMHLLYSIPRVSPFGSGAGGGFGGGRGGRGGGAAVTGRFVVLDLSSGETRELDGDNPVASADGSTIAFSTRDGVSTVLSVLELDDPGAEPRVVFQTPNRFQTFEISPSGNRLVVQMMLRDDWELFLVDTAAPEEDAEIAANPTPATGRGEAVRLTNDIQHDLAARFLADDTVLAAIGEGRHRRSYLYDVNTLERTRLFHNNTVRTIAPEYQWVASADGSKILIVSERDGDTVTPERAVYVVDLSRKVTATDVIDRLEWNLAAERDLNERGRIMYAPITESVRAAVSKVSIPRLYRYQKDLFDFGSKNITQPGHEPARQYLAELYESFGYESAIQWFETQARGSSEPIRTANVLAMLEGTENPELIYVISSHFDSTSRGPGADDNTSGTVMLLETARVLADTPLPYTVIFASFTGEESGLLGSREYVRQSVENGDKLVAALNNDMMGWANDYHIDNTVRYSNEGIRDVQHAAAFLFSDLVTYDAHYYKSTDAAAYYEAYGDIVGGFGSYPVLSNPHYHQTHDVLETIDQELIAETTKANVATIMLLASSPSRLNGFEIVSREGNSVELEWDPSPENSVFEYVLRVAPEDGPYEEFVVSEPGARFEDIPDGTQISVKAVSSRGLRGWDWAHVTVGR